MLILISNIQTPCMTDMDPPFTSTSVSGMSLIVIHSQWHVYLVSAASGTNRQLSAAQFQFTLPLLSWPILENLSLLRN